MALNEDSRLISAVKGTHSLIIQGFSFTKGLKVDDFLLSDTFSVGGHSWQIQFYPAPDKKDYVELYIALVSKCEGGVEAYVEFAFLDQTGNKWTYKGEDAYDVTMGPFMDGPYTITDTWGFDEFYERTELESSQFIKDDCLTIQCTIGVVKTVMDCPKPIAVNMRLLASKEDSDVIFEVEGETFYAHKIILSIESPVFKEQFLYTLYEKKIHFIKIEEVQAHIFKALLHFIYCDVIPDVGEEPVDLETTIMLQQLLVAADRYGLERLKSLCESILCKNILVSTAASSLALAEYHGCYQLKSSCLEFIGLPRNLNAVMKTDAFKNLKESCPSLVDDLLRSLARYTYVTCGPGSEG